ncbi:hypothetical protein TNCV_132511 [Trichonephila clavipes]|nr:hypothetical protein TNCV_132511 [Trichonephila clavipes]
MVKCRGRHLSWHSPLLTTTPHQREDVSALDRFSVHRCPTRMGGRCSRVVKVSDRGRPSHEFEPSTTKEPPCRGAMHVKSVESSNILPLVWCGS